MDLSTLPQHWCSHRFGANVPAAIIVVHTNEGPEGPNSAEGLAAYIAQPNVVPGYHFTVDENSIVQTCPLTQRCNGAGGVNSKAIHVCLTGYAAQSSAQWHDPASRAAIALARDLVATLAHDLAIPHVRITDPRSQHGVCGHVDVSRYFSASMGHSDPGTSFPWDELLGGAAPAPAPAPVRMDGMAAEFTYNDGHSIFLVEGAQRMHVSQEQLNLYTLAAAKETPPRTIPNLGTLNASQIETMKRVPIVGPA